jgi:cytochrome c oxidase cbb3-type subunit 3/ubiquinol-cytochrome c reductase cytochrome c subunit
MRVSLLLPLLALGGAMLFCASCGPAPGYPKPGPEVGRPDELLDFHALYAQNCSGCHGENGTNGAALPLNNPAYLAIAGPSNLRAITSRGVKGTLMPAFAKGAGGMLTDAQIEVLVQGMTQAWGKPSQFAGVALPAYAATQQGDPVVGQKAFVTACSRCHGADGLGVKQAAGAADNGTTPFPIVDSAFLALISDQSLRSLVLGGRPDDGMPDWRTYITGPNARPLTEQETEGIVAWLTAHRAPQPGEASRPPAKTGASAMPREGR